MLNVSNDEVRTYGQAIRDLAEAAERFNGAARYGARDEAERVAIALCQDLVPPTKQVAAPTGFSADPQHEG